MAAEDSEVNLRNSIFSIDVSKSPRSIPVRKGTACAMKAEGSTRVVLVTSRNAAEHGGKLSSTRFCAGDYEDEHTCTLESKAKAYVEQFCFIPLQTTPKYFLKLVGTNKLRETREKLIQSKCLSYTFYGNSFKTLTWEFSKEQKTHGLTKVYPKGDLVASACRGSPVVSTQDEDRSVIGVVNCTSEGDLCLVFFNESSLDIEETTQAEEKKRSKERTPKEFQCLWDREVQSIDGFQGLLNTVLKINLDPRRALGGDYRSLAGVFGKDMNYIWYLESKSSPIELLLQDCRPSLKFLKDMLSSKEVCRKDVAKAIAAWVEENCSCSNCSSSLR